MHAVSQINIKMPSWPKHRVISFCFAAARMRSFVFVAIIGLNFGNHQSNFFFTKPPDKIFAKQFFGHQKRIFIEKIGFYNHKDNLPIHFLKLDNALLLYIINNYHHK